MAVKQTGSNSEKKGCLRPWWLQSEGVGTVRLFHRFRVIKTKFAVDEWATQGHVNLHHGSTEVPLSLLHQLFSTLCLRDLGPSQPVSESSVVGPRAPAGPAGVSSGGHSPPCKMNVVTLAVAFRHVPFMTSYV